MDIYNWIIANKVVLGGGGILAILAGPKGLELAKMLLAKIKALVSKVKNGRSTSLVTTSVDDVDLELADQQAIRHLRDRASAMGNAKLVAIIKEADSIFFDIHTGTNVPTSVESAVTLKE